MTNSILFLLSIRINVDSTVLSIFQKTVTFDHNLTPLRNFIAFYFKYFFVGIYILNEKVKDKQICKSKDCWVIDGNTFDSKWYNRILLSLVSSGCIVLSDFKRHYIIMLEVNFMKTVNGCKDVSIMSPQDEQWRRKIYAVRKL